MDAKKNRKTNLVFWNNLYSNRIRMSLPSMLVVATRNIISVLMGRIKPGDKVLEIGFAPGKLLSFVCKVMKAEVSGIDYSKNGMAASKKLFQVLGIIGDLQCEDIAMTTFKNESFDFVYSNGLIEHFEDPCEIVKKHVELAKPGGRIILIVPNYSDFYGRFQKMLDPDNLNIHNLHIMSEEGMRKIVPQDLVEKGKSFLHWKV